jgi:malate dehydrogenase (oxaloacetate-decarboxylating)
LTIKQDAIDLHRILKGKIEIHNRVSVENVFEDEKGTLGLIYTPGVAHVAEEISNNKQLVYSYTSKWNNVAIICDGTRVLGLGNIGPEGALPVMEGKSVLFKILSNINAIPLCISTRDKNEIIRFVKAIEPGFGAINIEDIESPKVLEIINVLQQELSIPVFHDDQHGTAVIALAALINALKLTNKDIHKVKVVISGSGSAGYGIFKILDKAKCNNVIVMDSRGAIYRGRPSDTQRDNPYKQEISRKGNPENLTGNIGDVIKGADVFVGVSGKANLLNNKMVQSMNNDAIIFALSNPDPEIIPSKALEAGAAVVATGRSDYPNQVNNAIVFPSILRALLDMRSKVLEEEMLVSVGYAIAEMVDDSQLRKDYIIPKVNDPRILPIVNRTLRDAIAKHMDKNKKDQDTSEAILP